MSSRRSSHSSLTLRDVATTQQDPAMSVKTPQLGGKSALTGIPKAPDTLDPLPQSEKPRIYTSMPKDGIRDEERALAPTTDLIKVVTPKGELLYVGWDGSTDPANPRNWSAARKWTIVIIGSAFCGLVSMTVSGYSLAVSSIEAELHTTREIALLGIFTFTMTFGGAPLLLAPLSEIYGRRYIIIFSAILFTLFHIPQALAPNITCMVMSRLIAGIGASSAISLVAGSLSDLFTNEQRGIPMAIFTFAAFSTTGLGPMFVGFVAQDFGFRDVFWILFALSAFCTIFICLLQKETRESVLLSHKAAKLRKTTGDHRFVAQADEERASFMALMKIGLTRPARLFLTEPILQAFTLWVSFAWAVLYLLFVSIPITFQGVYGFDLGQTGLVYSTELVGSIIGFLLGWWGDRKYQRDVAIRGPEARMWTGICGAVLFPLGIWIFTYTSWASVHWIAPCIGITITYAGLMLIYMTVFGYLSDCYTMYAASALSAMNVFRNTLGAVFPLFSTAMYDKLGLHSAGALIAAIATVLSICPIIALHYGARLRQNSRYAKELASMHRVDSSATEVDQ